MNRLPTLPARRELDPGLPAGSKLIEIQYPGRCSACGEACPAGQVVCWWPGGRLAHTECAAEKKV